MQTRGKANTLTYTNGSSIKQYQKSDKYINNSKEMLDDIQKLSGSISTLEDISRKQFQPNGKVIKNGRQPLCKKKKGLKAFQKHDKSLLQTRYANQNGIQEQQVENNKQIESVSEL